jgi:hypothetical protein
MVVHVTDSLCWGPISNPQAAAVRTAAAGFGRNSRMIDLCDKPDVRSPEGIIRWDQDVDEEEPGLIHTLFWAIQTHPHMENVLVNKVEIER